MIFLHEQNNKYYDSGYYELLPAPRGEEFSNLHRNYSTTILDYCTIIKEGSNFLSFFLSSIHRVDRDSEGTDQISGIRC